MNTNIDVIGIYRVESGVLLHLKELLVKNSQGAFNLLEIPQKTPAQPKQNWQVPWNEKSLDDSGKKGIADSLSALEKPLLTPFGVLALSNENKKSERLPEVVHEPQINIDV